MGRKMTEEEIQKRKEKNDKTNAKIIQKNKEERELLSNALEEVKKYDTNVLVEYSNNLPTYLENKKQYIAKEIAMQKSELSLPRIMRALGKDFSSVVGEPIYSAKELAIVFEYYQDVMIEINERTKLPPTRQNFCMFSGLATTTFDSYLKSKDKDKQIVAQRIEDYIIENNWTSASKGTLNAYAVEKRTRLKGIGGGYTEAKDDVNINITNQTKSPEEMLKNVENLFEK